MVGIAQLVERRVVVADVAGSSPVTHPRREQAPGSPGGLLRLSRSGGDVPEPALLEVVVGGLAPRPWCSSRTGPPRPPAPGSGGRRRRSRRAPAVRLSCPGRSDGEVVSRAEDRSLAGPDRPRVGADRPIAAEHIDQRVEVDIPRKLETGAGLDRGVHQRHRRVGGARARRSRRPGRRSRGPGHPRRTTWRGRPAGPDVLVARRNELLVARQVHPELDAVEEAALLDQPLRRGLDVEQAAARRSSTGCRRW